MALALAVAGGLAFWDSRREFETATADFAQQQVSLTHAVSAEIRATWTALGDKPRDEREGLAWLTRALANREKPGRIQTLVVGPAGLVNTAEAPRFVPALTEAVARGADRVILRREDVRQASLVMPNRLAVAGIDHVDLGVGGRWSFAVVATAEGLRDRQQRAAWRLGLSMAGATGLVLFFGGWAMKTQRRQLLLAHRLELARLARQADERLTRANKAATLGTLAIGIAHEISTPLSVIAIRAEQLRPAPGKTLPEGRVAQIGDVILQQTERIGQTIRALLGLVRGDVPLSGEAVAEEVVRGAISLVEHRFAQRNVRLRADVARDLPLLGGDPRLLEQALVNLLLNACDASEAEGEVTVRARRDGRNVEIAVLDEGSGIPDLETLGAPALFFTTKPRGQGSGLGLAITREILASHRGELALEARQPRGTAAKMRLPAETTTLETNA